MKKATSLVLALSLAAALLAGCGKNDPTVTTTSSDNLMQTTVPETTQGQSLETDEKLLTVEITFPASMFEDEDMSTFDPDAYAKENDFISAKVNEDGSITVKMSKLKHHELLKEMTEDLEANFAELIEAVDTPYIKEITHNDDFSEVNVKVVRADYENAFDLTPFVVGISATFYQTMIDMETHVEVNMIDVDTGEVITSVVYPDALIDASNALESESNP